MATRLFMEKFGVPPEAEGVIDLMIPAMGQDFLTGIPEGVWFSPRQATGYLSRAAGRPIDVDEARAVLRLAYERGELDLADDPAHYAHTRAAPAETGDSVWLFEEETGEELGGERFRLGDFFTFLDVFSVAEPERWAALPAVIRRQLEAAYLKRYIEGLDVGGAVLAASGGEDTISPVAGAPDGTIPGRTVEDGSSAPVADRRGNTINPVAGAPTLDEVLPADEVIKRIMVDKRPVYLSPCDCRALHGHGGGAGDMAESYCLSYREVPGSFASRGLSRRITREEAADVVRRADRAGLVHTVNPNGICNCCPCCCYLFRSREKLGTGAVWPRANYIVAPQPALCTACGACEKRCPFGVFTLAGPGMLAGTHIHNSARVLSFDLSKCVGCGLCVSSCPAGALELEKR